jgi:hypothetical protein
MITTELRVTEIAPPTDYSRYREELNTFIWNDDETAGTWKYIQIWVKNRTNYTKIIGKMDEIVRTVKDINDKYTRNATASHYNPVFGDYISKIIDAVEELKSSLLPIQGDFKASMESINNILLKISL